MLKRIFIALAALLVVILVVLVIVLRPMLSHQSPPGEAFLEAHPHRLSVLTWNTARMGGFAKPEANRVLKMLLKQDADVICLQEVDVYKDEKYLTLGDMKRTLGKKYKYSYIDFAIYNKRHQFGTMVWSKYPLINKQTIQYESRGNISNQCDVVVGADTIRLMNNHLESYSFTAADLDDLALVRDKWERATPIRNAQARKVREKVETSPYPVILVGDFNASPLSFAYRHIRKGMHDAWLETSWLKWGATCHKRGYGVRIDYILSSPELVPVSCAIEPTNASDHYPMTATLAW